MDLTIEQLRQKSIANGAAHVAAMQELSTPPPMRAWSPDDLKEILEGPAEENTAVLRKPDAHGLTPAGFAVLKGASNSEALLPLLGLLEAPETDRIALVIDLLTKVLESQLRTETLVLQLAERNSV